MLAARMLGAGQSRLRPWPRGEAAVLRVPDSLYEEIPASLSEGAVRSGTWVEAGMVLIERSPGRPKWARF